MRIPWMTVVLVFTFGASAESDSAVYSTARRPRALALIGDRYHSPVSIRHTLFTALVRETIPVTFIE